ncbi:hypothetical protein CU102_26575 [Phyllobacterium brassicacearum]|uniref:Uncharacterized protein n=1 Tax=Phyllobacterium brassicacearum TaxID=314235 RepID=A0A2P7B5K0_9HYPH|nr:hypothetical protein [Phyllobacterium brassicacearum]PSH61745.1 hypothetical protein CU102_26575 [Phyllobacterium brassicacearum]TDQ15295.1 hypothetical protein DEV91_1346 [Phyllobacterium brassicacearum]
MAGDKGLTALEKRIVKALLAKGERNQDIHALINYERTPTVNFGRITTVKKDATRPVLTHTDHRSARHGRQLCAACTNPLRGGSPGSEMA